MGAPGSAAVSQNSCGSAELAAWQGWGPHPGASWSWPRSLPAHAAMHPWGCGSPRSMGRWRRCCPRQVAAGTFRGKALRVTPPARRRPSPRSADPNLEQPLCPVLSPLGTWLQPPVLSPLPTGSTAAAFTLPRGEGQPGWLAGCGWLSFISCFQPPALPQPRLFLFLSLQPTR